MEFLLGHSVWAFRSGELAFARGWPMWLLMALAALGLVAIVVTLLRRPELRPWQRGLMGLLQFLFFALLLVLLWRPVLNVERIRDRENVVAVVVDGLLTFIDRALLLKYWPGDAASLDAVAGVAHRVARWVPSRIKSRIFGPPAPPSA